MLFLPLGVTMPLTILPGILMLIRLASQITTLIVVGLEVDVSTFAGFTRYITGIDSYYSACLPV
jgi:hypothetical protein